MGRRKSPKAEAKKVRDDFRYFLHEYWYHGKDRLRANLGKVHDLMCDFLRLEELGEDGVPGYTTLQEHMPEKDVHGEWVEKWLYWPVLGGDPIAQDGEDGEVSEMFHERFWRGTIIRIKGNGMDKCLLIPRNHLKTEIASGAFPTWKVARDPFLNCIIRSQVSNLAKKVCGMIKSQFESNAAVRELYGHLKPDRGRGIWSNNAIQLVTADIGGNKDYTIETAGIKSELTGAHFMLGILDDITGEQNVQTPESRAKVVESVRALESVRSPGATLLDVGTVWTDDDHHAQYIRKDGHSYDCTSFMVATVEQEDGSPLWPEVFTEREIKRREKKHRGNMYHWMCQYFNQPVSQVTATFKEEWFKTEDYIPEDKVEEASLNVIAITVDPASRDNLQNDDSAACVQGQTPDRETRYVLDGFDDRIHVDKLPGYIVDLIEKWWHIARKHRCQFKIGIESDSFQYLLARNVQNLMRARGIPGFNDIIPLTHGNRNKEARISQLAPPYSTGSIVWPTRITKYSQKEKKSYNLTEVGRQQMKRFPYGAQDGLLDAQAYGEDILMPLRFKVEETDEGESPILHPSAYNRRDVIKEMDRGSGLRPPKIGTPGTGQYSRGKNIRPRYGRQAFRTPRKALVHGR